ncbi:restriction endonuclease subunit S [Micromonospora sp. NPDC047074]|uniref:restriction endonuclease subunit S n=1 Tax=Micromonospora sp. NPDC047074 TaxID=3154339 RepID=UPI0033D5D9D7
MSSVLGVSLPKSWSSAPLKHVTSLLNRGAAPTYVDDGQVRVIGQAANQAAGLNWNRTRFHEFDGDPRHLKGYLLPNDVLINSTGTGTLGRVGYFIGAPDDSPCVADGHITVARATDKKLHPRFAFYWLASKAFKDYASAALVVGATNQIELSRDRLGNAPVPLPPLEEQRRIADFLDTETTRIDRMREATARQVALMAERFKELVRQETTVGIGPSIPTGVVWMPRMNHEWRLGKISHEFCTGSGTTPTSSNENYFNGPHSWVNSADLNDGLVSHTEKSVTEEALADFSALNIYPTGSLIVALYGQGATKGRVGILGIDACLNQACCALIPIGEISVEFAHYWFRGHKDGIITLAVGAGQPNLSQELIRQLRIPIPNEEHQRLIVENLHAEEQRWQRQSALLRNRGELLDERRQALITAAVTGQVDVSAAVQRPPNSLSS